MKTVLLELTEGQVLAILDALPGSGYSGCYNLMRKIDKQLEAQTNEKFKLVRGHLRHGGGKQSINSLNKIYEAMQ